MAPDPSSGAPALRPGSSLRAVGHPRVVAPVASGLRQRSPSSLEPTAIALLSAYYLVLMKRQGALAASQAVSVHLPADIVASPPPDESFALDVSGKLPE